MDANTFPHSLLADPTPNWRLTLHNQPAGWEITLSSIIDGAHRFQTLGERGDDVRFHPSRESALRHVAWGLLLWNTERAMTAPISEIEAALQGGVSP